MRSAKWFIAFCGFFLACGGGGSTLGPPPADMSGTLNCADTFGCILTCTAANVNTCIPACIARTESGAQQYFTPLQTCGSTNCYDQDGGAPACFVPSSAQCMACVDANCANELAACKLH